MCRQRGVHFETCPTSSYLTGAVKRGQEPHPIAVFARDGANFSINKNDSTLTRATLEEECKLAGLGIMTCIQAVSEHKSKVKAQSAHSKFQNRTAMPPSHAFCPTPRNGLCWQRFAQSMASNRSRDWVY